MDPSFVLNQTANILRCTSSNQSTLIDMSIFFDKNMPPAGSILAKVNLNQGMSTLSSEIMPTMDIKGWSYFAVYIDHITQIARFTLQDRISTQSKYIGSTMLSSIIQNTKQCTFGGQEFQGSIKNLVFASGLKATSISDYHSRYAHNTVNALDPFLISNIQFFNESEISQVYMSQTGNFTIKKTNEPEIVCRCLSDDADENYLLLSPWAGYLDLIRNVWYPDAGNFNLTASFTANIKRTTNSVQQYHPLMSHEGLWTFGIYNKTVFYLNITGVTDIVFFRQIQTIGRVRNTTIFLNQWIRYTLQITEKFTQLVLEDLSGKSITIHSWYNNAINVDEVLSELDDFGNFEFRTLGAELLVKDLSYIPGSNSQFNFNLTLDNFMMSSSPSTVFQGNALTRTFNGQFLSGNVQLNSLYPGLSFEQIPGPCNNSDTFFDGLVCKDKPKALFLNSRLDSGKRVEGFLTSQSGMYTFEVWLKFMGMQNSNQQQAILMSTYNTQDNPVAQISITRSGSSSTFNVQCDPYAKTPRIAGLQDPVIIFDSVQLNVWSHLSCTSNSSAKEMKAFLFDLQNQFELSSVVSGSSMISGSDNVPIRTVFGNNLQGDQPYQGMLRELRIWKRPKTQQEIQYLRFQSIPYLSTLREQMYLYNSFAQGRGTQEIDLDQFWPQNTQQIYLQQIANFKQLYPSQIVSPISWKESSDLVICPPDTIFNSVTNCCIKATFYATIKRSTFSNPSDGKQYLSLQLSIQETQTNNQGLYQHNWKILDVKNYQPQVNVTYEQHVAQIQKYLNQTSQSDENREAIIPQDVLQINATYNFKGSVRSLIRNYEQVSEQQIQVKADCPQIQIFPKLDGNQPFAIALSMDPSKLNFTTEIRDQCFDPQITTQSIQWTLNPSSVTFNISQDQKSIQFKQFGTNIASLQITVTLNYKKQNDYVGTTFSISDQVFVNFVTKPFKLGLETIPSTIDASKSDLIFNPAYTLHGINYPISLQDRQIVYSVTCPDYLFVSLKDQNRYCTPSQTDGVLRIQKSNTKAVNYVNYKFVYTISSPLLRYSESKEVYVTFFEESYFFCPGIMFNQITSYKALDERFVISPTIYLNCIDELTNTYSARTKYFFTSVNWFVDGYQDASTFLDIYDKVAVVKKSNILKPGFTTNITIKGKLNNGTVISAKTNFIVSKTEIVVNILNKKTNKYIAFNETMQLDSSLSYDPDQPDQILQAKWTYENGKYSFDGSLLQLSPFDRLNQGLSFGASNPENFDLNLTNPTYQKFPTLATTQVFFDHHVNFRKSVFSAQCNIQLISTQDTYYFAKNNASDIWLSATIDQNACFSGTKLLKNEGYIYSYVPQSLLSAYQTMNYKQSNSVFIGKDVIESLDPASSVKVDFIYLASYVNSDGVTQYDYIVRSITINKISMPIIIQIAGVANLDQTITVGTESTLILDASTSYDMDYPDQATQFTFSWTCPTGMTCESVKAQQSITKAMRVQNLVNSVGSTFKVGIQIYSPRKVSQVKFLNIKVVKQNLGDCLTVNLQNSGSNILKLPKDAEFPYQIKLNPLINCDQVSIDSVAWSSQNGLKFWEDSPIPIQITVLSQEKLPQTNSVQMNAVVSYTISTSTDTSKQSLNFGFIINIEPSALVPQITTDLIYGQVFELQQKGSFTLSASKTIDRENPTQQLQCQWTCSRQIISKVYATDSCDVTFQASDFKLLNITSQFEIAEFNVQIQTLDGRKYAKRSVFVTLVQPIVSLSLPLCYIYNPQGKIHFEIDEQMQFYPSCFPSVINQTFPHPFDYEWQLTPNVTGISLKDYKLDISKFALLNNMKDKSAGFITIQLRVFSKFVEYRVQRTFTIPKMFDNVPGSFPKFELSPSAVTTLINQLQTSVTNYTLQNNQYYRLRLFQTNNQGQLAIAKTLNNTNSLYLPKQTMSVYLDIIEGKKSGDNNYNIYTLKPSNLIVDDPKSLSKSVFNFQIYPRLQTEINTSSLDFNDISSINTLIDQYLILKSLISGVKDSQSVYNTMIYNQVMKIYPKITQNSLLLDGSKEKLRIQMKYLELLQKIYVELCPNDIQDLNTYLQTIQQDLLSQKQIYYILDTKTEVDIKQGYMNLINALVQSSCLQYDTKLQQVQFSNQIFASIMIEGDYGKYINPLDKTDIYTVYKISDFDQLSSNMIKYQTPDLNVSFSLLSSKLPFLATYILIKQQDLSTLISKQSEYLVGKSYYSANSMIQIDLRDDFFAPYEMDSPDESFSIDITFQINKNIVTTVQNEFQASKFFCLARETLQDEYNFTYPGDMKVQISEYDLSQQKATCTSKHLSQFTLAFVPFRNYYDTADLIEIKDQKLGIFYTSPLLVFLLPSVFLMIILILAVLGLIMSRLELKKNDRFYNKLTLTENLQKYTFTRLWACLILQLNPIFNYVFKTNFYLSRPLRLLILVTYFLFISLVVLLYFRWLPSELRIADIFWFGASLQGIILVMRPRLQDLLFKMFYPKTITNWGSKYREERRPRSGNKQKKKKTLTPQDLYSQHSSGDNLESDDKADMFSPSKKGKLNFEQTNKRPYSSKPNFENSMRYQNSGERFVINLDSTKKVDETNDQILPYHIDSPDQNKGDEIMQYRETKKKKGDSRQKIGQTSSQEDYPQNGDLFSKSRQNAQYQNSDGNNSSNSSLNDANSDEMDLTKKQRDSRDLLRSSLESSSHLPDINQHRDYAGFQFEPIADDGRNNFLRSTGPVHIDLQSQDISAINLDESREDIDDQPHKQKEVINQDEEEYYYEDVDLEDKDAQNIQKEGGDQEESKEMEESSSPTPLRSSPKINQKGNDADSETQGKQDNSAKGQKVNIQGDIYNEQSTQTLENIYKNYRILREQQTSPCWKAIGYCLFLFILFIILGAHLLLLENISLEIFQDWISCTVFTFTVMIFGVDVLLYLMVAWALKRSNGVFDKRKCCTMYNLLIFWPLGNYKWQELEIEIAKMKDFDKEYYMAGLA